MYPDPNRIKGKRITVRLDTYEHNLIRALADYQGEQVATLLRRMALKEAASVLTDENSINQASA